MWNPTEAPYRVTWTRSAPPPTNWNTRIETFATESEARAAFESPMRRGEYEVAIHLAINTETWARNGKWSPIDRRNRRPQSKAI
jgi:hypothetical protein